MSNYPLFEKANCKNSTYTLATTAVVAVRFRRAAVNAEKQEVAPTGRPAEQLGQVRVARVVRIVAHDAISGAS